MQKQVRWSGIPISFIPQFIVIHTVKDFGIVNKAEIGIFLELSCSFDDPADVDNLISGSSAFSTTCLNIWKFMVHVLLKPGLENFKRYFTNLWDECNCAVVWVGDGQGGLVCCSSWGLKESDTTEWLNGTELNATVMQFNHL